MEQVGIGIIGTGFGATVQLPGFLRIPAAKVIGIASRDQARSEALRAEHHLSHSFLSWQELIDCPEVELVSITTPPAFHAEIARACIAAKKAVLCEKPFTMSVSDAKDLVEKADTAEIVHGMDFEFRDIPAWKAFHDHVKSGVLGKIISAEFEWVVGTWARMDRPWAWQCDKAQGGGILGALGVHIFDAMEWVIGPASSLSAKTGIGIPERADASGQIQQVTAEDHATIDLRVAGDIPVSIRLSNVDAGGKGLLMKVNGEQGSVALHSTSQNYGMGFHVTKELNGVSMPVFTDDRDIPGDARIPPFQAIAERFIAAVQTHNRAFVPSFREGLRSQMILDGVFRSAETGTWVDIGASAK